MVNLIQIVATPFRRAAIGASRRFIQDTMQAVDDLPGLDPMQRRLLRVDVRRAICRPRAKTTYFTQLWMPVYFLLSAMSAIGVLIGTSAWTKGLESKLITVGFTAGAASTIVIMFIAKRLNGRYRRSRLLKIYLQSSFMLYLFSFLAYSALRQPWTGVTLSAASIPMTLFIGVYSYSIFVAVGMRRQSVSAGTIYGRAARSMLETAAFISRNRSKWDSARVARKAVAAIEDLGRTCQDTLALRSRIGVWHADVFSQTATEALRVAHLVREHKKLIVCASTEDDFERVAISFSNGLAALLQNDRSKLLENAPEAVRKERFKILIQHLLPVVLFTTAAITLPMVPPISNQDKIAESVRLTFIVAAVLSLVSPRSDSSTRILDVLGKALPSK
ncbi:hypothetical protein [Streptomyces cellostaticus]|uniref:hypothetical protein n=1 Tax=Streptomyces cellostaticus TaxID=67285 RepID=UPI00131B964B|nr:hypothetical protein [Streptomyces cellostaticus]